MTRITTSIAVALLWSGLPAPVAAAASRPGPLWGYLSPVPPRETPAEVRAFADVRTSLDQVIAAACADCHGRVIEIGFVRHKDTRNYDVVIGTPDGLHYVRVDPATGAVRSAGRPDVARAELDEQGLRDLAAVETAKITLAEAVRAAEKLTGGVAIAAGVEQLEGVPQYYVQTMIKRKLVPIIVNPETGGAARPLK